MKLYEVPNNSKLVIDTDSSKKELTFHHIDGMYSYITDEDDNVYHLYANQEMEKVNEHYEIKGE